MKKQVVTILLALSMSFFLVACGEPDTTPEPAVEQNNDVQDETTEEIIEAEHETETNEEITPSEEVHQAENNDYLMYMAESELVYDIVNDENREPRTVVLIWKNEAKEAHFLENGCECDVKDGDVIMLYELFDDEDKLLISDGFVLPDGTHNYFEIKTDNVSWSHKYVVKHYFIVPNLSDSFEFVYEPHPHLGNHKYDFKVTLNPEQ